jgi:O-acetyl-ADP-ribose deacetylase (regulator of RNase III)
VELQVWRGDITTLDVDAIVNAANAGLTRGGGVCGAIFAAAGPGLDEACAALAPCPTGGVVATPGFGLRARWVLHAVGPMWRGGHEGEADQLARCYRRIVQVAGELGATSVAVPAISTCIYGFPADEAAEVAVSTLRAAAGRPAPDRVVLVAFDRATERRYGALVAATAGAAGAGDC